jgi:hypothetical protein
MELVSRCVLAEPGSHPRIPVFLPLVIATRLLAELFLPAMKASGRRRMHSGHMLGERPPVECAHSIMLTSTGWRKTATLTINAPAAACEEVC